VTISTTWRAGVPREIVALVAAVAIGGSAAGILASTPLLLFTSPLLAAALAAAAALAPERVRLLAQLPESRARELLVDLLRRAEVIPDAAQVNPLVSAACQAARQLYVLEVHLAAFHAQDERLSDASPRWRDAYERCTRGKELLVQRLQDASAALSRWQASQGDGESLDVLARELSDESRHQQEAAQEVEALLA
jgi:hypothetical protein